MRIIILLVISMIVCFCQAPKQTSTSYYFDSEKGDDTNSGIKPNSPFRNLSKIKALNIQAGDQIYLKSGGIFNESLELVNLRGTKSSPILVSTYDPDQTGKKAVIKALDQLNGILIENSSFLEVRDLDVSTSIDKSIPSNEEKSMRCGVLIKATREGNFEHVYLRGLDIHDVFYHKKGFTRPKNEVKSANGTQNYGWGIRVINNEVSGALIEDLRIDLCTVRNVAHTGIKLTGENLRTGKSIRNFAITANQVEMTGGPGIQMSLVENGYITSNKVNRSGSANDSRKWGRGSGLWTWGSDNILIERNSFTNANGPGDSAGAHIDYNCTNVVLQYNFSANNAGGFCEILGNNYNCAYRYNISANDGYRVKGQNGAFQEGKILWLSGFVGDKPRSGPFNSYIYNNTIYVADSIEAKMAMDRAAKGILIANNIFHLKGKTLSVKGDQYKPDTEGEWKVSNVSFSNNLFINDQSWPENLFIRDENPIYGDAGISPSNPMDPTSFIPANKELVADGGMDIRKIDGDSIGITIGLKVSKDFFGNPIKGLPDLGAVELD